MSNAHWSQFSHKPKFFFVSAIPFMLTLPLIVMGQITSMAYWILLIMWLYVIVFEIFLKMPLQYTPSLIRTKLTGTTKLPRNDKDNLQL